MSTSMSELEIWFPGVISIIEMLWGSKDLDQYFEKIMLIEPGKKRMGFPDVVMEELFMLHSVHQDAYPQAPIDVWKNSFRK